VFIVQKETSTIGKRKKKSSVQLPPECDLDPDCYITAEIDSSLVDSDGYNFRVGMERHIKTIIMHLWSQTRTIRYTRV